MPACTSAICAAAFCELKIKKSEYRQSPPLQLVALSRNGHKVINIMVNEWCHSTFFCGSVLRALRERASIALEALLKAAWANQTELRILVTGKTGEGKSTLVNGILGEVVATEGADSIRCTAKVEGFTRKIQDVPVTVFDSPGLQDNTANEEVYLREMRLTCQRLSLVLYCTKMINTRLTDNDKHAMEKLLERNSGNILS